RDLLRQIVTGRKRRDRPRAVVGAKALEQATTVGAVDAGDRDRSARGPRCCPHAHTTLVRATKVPYREQREKPRILGSWRRAPESFEPRRTRPRSTIIQPVGGRLFRRVRRAPLP